MFEAGTGAPPSIPSADDVKSILGRDLGLKVAKIGNPTRLLFLGFDNLFAVYQAGRQEVAVNLAFDFAMPASNLTAIATLPSPEEYKANKEATERARPEVLASYISTAQSTRGDIYNELNMSTWCKSCYSGYSCNPPLSSEGKKVCWCGPTSGVIIGHYYKDEEGYSYLMRWTRAKLPATHIYGTMAQGSLQWPKIMVTITSTITLCIFPVVIFTGI
jgi:hypothetical protein